MTERMRLASERLKQSGAACVAANRDSVLSESLLPGIKPLIAWLETEPENLEGSSVADKVVGKAAALLLIYGRVGEVYAEIISESAAEYLQEHRIPFDFGRKVPYILNRDGTGMCPMEQRCLQIDDPGEGYEALKKMIRG